MQNEMSSLEKEELGIIGKAMQKDEMEILVRQFPIEILQNEISRRMKDFKEFRAGVMECIKKLEGEK